MYNTNYKEDSSFRRFHEEMLEELKRSEGEAKKHPRPTKVLCPITGIVSISLLNPSNLPIIPLIKILTEVFGKPVETVIETVWSLKSNQPYLVWESVRYAEAKDRVSYAEHLLEVSCKRLSIQKPVFLIEEC